MRLTVPIVVVVIAALVVAGAFMLAGRGNGTLVVQVTDQPNAIGDFESLVVVVSSVMVHSATDNAWLDMQPATGSFDLVQLQGENVETILSAPLAAGMYTQIRIVVSRVDGTLKDNSMVEVGVPSDDLKLVRSFSITAGRTTRIEIDLNVVKEATGYLLTPVSGMVFTE